MKARDGDNTNWGAGSCFDMMPRALVLTLCATLLNMRAVWRYVRYDVMP